jgi:hypothetical protein
MEELRLVNSRVSSQAIEVLLDQLNERNYVKRLSLVKANIGGEKSIAKLCTLIAGSRHLIELDLSWNGLRPNNIQPLLECLAENRLIQNLNLSWNNLQIAEMKQVEVGTTPRLHGDSAHVVSKVTRIIKYNKNLLHFNISHCGLTEQAVRDIGASLRRGKSILSLHLSGNPGITQEVKMFLHERIRCAEVHRNDLFDAAKGSPTK